MDYGLALGVEAQIGHAAAVQGAVQQEVQRPAAGQDKAFDARGAQVRHPVADMIRRQLVEQQGEGLVAAGGYADVDDVALVATAS